MNNQGGNFGRGPPSNNNNMYGHDLRDLRAQLDPQYSAALEYEELRLRRELELHQDLELRRRLQSLASQQIVEELEYRQQLQQLQNMQNQQSQQNNFNNLLLQQQQYGNGDLLSSLQDEYLLQRHHQMLMQEQMQQRLMAEGLAQVGSQEQFGNDSPAMVMSNHRNTAAAYLEQEALRAAALATDEGLLEQARNLSRQAQGMGSALADSAPAPPEASLPFVAEANDVTVNASPMRTIASPKPEAVAVAETTKPSAKNEGLDSSGRTKKKTPKSKDHSKSTPKIKDHNSKSHGASSNSAKSKPGVSSAEREGILASAKSLASQKKPGLDNKGDVATETAKPQDAKKADESDEKKPAKKQQQPKSDEGATVEGAKGAKESIVPKLKRKKRKNSDVTKEVKPIQEITKSGKLDGRTKKARALKKQVLEEQRMLTDQEKAIVSFLSSKSTIDENGKPLKERKKKEEKKKKKKTEEHESDNEFAAGIVLKFKSIDNIPAHEIKSVNIWNKRGSHRQFDPVIDTKDYPQLTPYLKFDLPLLPVESELVEVEHVDTSKTKVDSLIKAINSSGIVSTEDSASILKDPVVDKEQGTVVQDENKKKVEKTHTDKWWPTDACIEHERQLLGDQTDAKTGVEDMGGGISFTKKSVSDAKERLEKSVEPGVLEILPHCKLAKLKGDASDEPKFCVQVASELPNEPMVCCSVCSTWRHPKCGGHYKHWTGRSADPSDAIFKPLCDRCYLEKDLLKDAGELAVKRIENQRTDHLRRSNATNAVMQQYAFSRHHQSKWPLGSVTPAHFAGHARGVQARHEKAEKLWEDMVSKLDSGKERSKDRVRTRSRVLERLLTSVEDAETNADIHNMILFLQDDTSKAHPVGFENFRRNIFDPEEDPSPAVVVEDLKSESTVSDIPMDGTEEDSKMKGVEILMESDTEPEMTNNHPEMITPDKQEKPKIETVFCARNGCQQKPRFDSVFCSDSCGVFTLERDLLHSLKYAQELHPSVLRSSI